MAGSDEHSFGYQLRRYRLAALLTQEQLAERAHLSYRTISDLERGAKHTPRRDTVLLLADALELSAEERATLVAAARPSDRQPEAGNPPTDQIKAEASEPISLPPLPAPVSEAPHATAPAAPVTEERRLITVLFCDLVGFTTLFEQLDPEEVREIQVAYFSAMNTLITRYGGTVEKYAGDAVVALFGVPAAHEDDPERAVLCALAMQQTIGPIADGVQRQYGVEVALRVGVDTGEVVTGSWNASGGQDVAVTGGSVSTAVRLQVTAEPGEVLVGRDTMLLSRRRIEYSEERLLALKGKSELVPSYSALGMMEQVGERWESIRQVSPLVGRERELAQILDLWERVTSGEGQLLTVIGEPGVGKSRLVSEGIERIRERSADIRLLRGRCLSYGQSISLWLIADLVRGLVGVREADGPDTVREAVRASLAALLADGDPEDRREAIDVLGEVLGFPAGGSIVAQAGPQVRRAALIRSLRRVLGTLSVNAPVVLVMEDLHWIDQASQEVIQDVLVDVPGLRVLVLAAQRQGWQSPWNQWSWSERLGLRPLGERDAAMLAGAVLGAHSDGALLAPDLLIYLGDRAGGNPFFVEELGRALQESGGLEEQTDGLSLRDGASEQLPATLTEVILARLDRLETQVKGVAQVSSVIGRNFAVRLLAQVMEQSQASLELPLTALTQAELAFPRRSHELEYVFKHAIVQEVAYGMLVQKRRMQLHLATARAIARPYPSDDLIEVIAYHYGKTEAPEAIEWLERAGDRAVGIYANETAILHYSEARRALERVGGDRSGLARLDEKLGGVLSTAGKYDEAIPILERALETCQQEADLEGAGRATALLGRTHRREGTPEEGIALVEPMIDLLVANGPSSALASLLIALSHLYFLVGRYHEMMVAAERGSEVARMFGDERLLGEAEMRRGTALTMMGADLEGAHALEEALPLVEAGGDLETLFITLTNLGGIAMVLGRGEQMRQWNERALTVAERIGNPSEICFSLCNVGEALLVLGKWEEARQMLQRALPLAKTTGSGMGVAFLQVSFGTLALWEGDWDEASRSLQESLAVAEETGDRAMRELAHAYLAELNVLRGGPEGAIRRLEPLVQAEHAHPELLPHLAWAYLCIDDGKHLQQAAAAAERAVSQRQKQPVFLVEALWVQGMVLIRQGRDEEATGVLNEGLACARSMPYPYMEARVLEQMGNLQLNREDPERAQARLEEAHVIFRRLGAAKDVERTEQALAKRARARSL